MQTRWIKADRLERGDWIVSYSTYVVDVERNGDATVTIHCSNRRPITVHGDAAVWVERAQ